MVERTPLEHWVSERIFNGRAFTPDALFAWQLDRLRSTIEWARAGSPFYARHLAGVRAPQSKEEISALPFLCEEDIRGEGHRMLCVSQSETARVVTLDTTGTTGPPKRLWFTRDEQEDIVDFFHYGMSTLTGPKDRVLILLPYAREGSVGDLLAAALARLGAVPVRHGLVQSLPETLNMMGECRADVLVGVPAQVRALAVYARAAGHKDRLKSVLLSTDHAPRAAVETIASQFGCAVFDHYGMTEMGLGGGVECAAHAGYHLRAPDLFFEVVDPVTRRPVPHGEYGEVVFSTLRRAGMPLIRYRTGDISRFMPGECPCGSRLRRLERITRRLHAGVRAGDRLLELWMLDEALFALPALLDFTAGVANAGEGLCLRVEAAALDIGEPACQQEDVERALQAVGEIARAVECGELVVNARVRAVSDWPNLHAGKRRLVRIEGEGP